MTNLAIGQARPEDHQWIIKAVGFLIGFLSPSREGVAYIHFAGVDPTQRSQSIGRRLYERFYELAREHGGSGVQAIASASNQGSIAFDRQLGFAVRDPIDDYDRPGVAHVQFSKSISASPCHKRW